MDWNNLLSLVAFAALVFFMRRGCGAGMCGMGHGGRSDRVTKDERAGKAA